MAAPSRLHGPLVVLPFLDGPRAVVVVAGDADGGTAQALHQQLLRNVGPGTRSLVVDLSELAGCDGQGVDALRTAVQAARDRGVAVSLRGPSPQLAQLLQSSALQV